jgi:hypothetical protein
MTDMVLTFDRTAGQSRAGVPAIRASQRKYGVGFRYDDDGRLAEEWIQTDNRSVLRQLGAQGR